MSRRKAPEDLLIQPRHEWKRAEVNLIKRELPGKSYAEVAAMISRKFGWNCQHYHVKKYCRKYGLKIRVRKGRAQIGEERLFPKNGKGQKPVKWWYVKVGVGVPGTDKDGWKPKHHILAEELGGKIPKGYVILFADGNTENCTIENLTLASMRQARSRAQITRHHGIRSYDSESSRVMNTLADYVYATSRRRSREMAKETIKKQGSLDEYIEWAEDTKEVELWRDWYSQLAELLKELKAYRQATENMIDEIESLDHDKWNYGHGVYEDIIRSHTPVQWE